MNSLIVNDNPNRASTIACRPPQLQVTSNLVYQQWPFKERIPPAFPSRLPEARTRPKHSHQRFWMSVRDLAFTPSPRPSQRARSLTSSSSALPLATCSENKPRLPSSTYHNKFGHNSRHNASHHNPPLVVSLDRERNYTVSPINQ